MDDDEDLAEEMYAQMFAAGAKARAEMDRAHTQAIVEAIGDPDDTVLE